MPFPFYERLRSEAGVSLDTLESLDHLIANEEDVYVHGVSISTDIISRIREAPREYRIRRDGSISRDNVIIHECTIGQKSYLFGTVNITSEERPTSMEELLVRAVISDHGETVNATDPVWIVPNDSEVEVFAEMWFHGTAIRNDTFFCRNTGSVYDSDRNSYIDKGKVIRHLVGSYGLPIGKYRFLETYRALELFTLSSILDELKSRFFSDARNALEKSLKAITNERRSLATSLSRAGVAPKFEAVHSFIKSVEGSNEYARVLIERGNNLNSDRIDGLSARAWLGICHIYDIRCSIAHSGNTGIVVEDYSDADLVLREASKNLEEIALEAIGFDALPSVPS